MPEVKYDINVKLGRVPELAEDATKEIKISVFSAGFEAGDYARILIDDVEVAVRPNKNGHHRGLHVVVLNPANNEIEWHGTFDTYYCGDLLDDFIWNELPDGYIVVAACKDEMTESISPVARKWFARMGSRLIWSLGYRCGFAFIGIRG